MSRDMNSGWGIRTLSSRSIRSMSYHNGSVWPHDNSLIAAGMKNYGFGPESASVIGGIISAGLRIAGNRLPELFCGFERDRRFNLESRPPTLSPAARKHGPRQRHSCRKPSWAWNRSTESP